MRVAIRIADDYLLDAQSNDRAPMDSLIANAKSAGYTEKEVRFEVMDDEAVAVRIKAQNGPPPKSTLQLLVDYVAAQPDAPDELKQWATKKG